MNEKFWNRTRIAVFAGLLAAIAIVAGWLYLPFNRAPEHQPPSAVQQMQQQPKAWQQTEKDASSLMADLQTGQIAAAGITRAGVLITTQTGEKYHVADHAGMISQELLATYMQAEPPPFPLVTFGGESEVVRFLELHGFSILLIVGLILYARGAFSVSFGFRSLRKGPGITFRDVIGVHEAKAAVRDVLAYLNDPKMYAEIGAKPPCGVLLTGPPGVGKTQLAKAIAGECGVNFIAASGSDFSSKWCGEGIQRVKALFRLARKKAPCILFIDEIDGIGKRGTAEGFAGAEHNRIVNQVLTELDGFSAAEGVVVIGATNFPESLDEALVREGRFDRKIYVPLPELEDRVRLFELYLGKLKVVEGLDIQRLARLSIGMTPAAIAYTVNQAALLAARAAEKTVRLDHLTEALEVCRIGEVTNMATPLSPAERHRTAVHEAGHAIASSALGVGRLEKVTILPRGAALGVTLVTPKGNRLPLRSEIMHHIMMLLAGRCAEQIVFGEVSAGASSDLKEASKVAMEMVAILGMTDESSRHLFSMDALNTQRAPELQEGYLREANGMLDTLYQRCLALITELRPALDAVAELLLDRETIPGEAVAQEIEKARGEIAEPEAAVA